ncbi:hypothetical protein LXL04_028610 [Taraxacum kok-saghyz]
MKLRQVQAAPQKSLKGKFGKTAEVHFPMAIFSRNLVFQNDDANLNLRSQLEDDRFNDEAAKIMKKKKKPIPSSFAPLDSSRHIFCFAPPRRCSPAPPSYATAYGHPCSIFDTCLIDILRLSGMDGELPTATTFMEFTAGDPRGMGEASGKVQRRGHAGSFFECVQLFVLCFYISRVSIGIKLITGLTACECRETHSKKHSHIQTFIHSVSFDRIVLLSHFGVL